MSVGLVAALLLGRR